MSSQISSYRKKLSWLSLPIILVLLILSISVEAQSPNPQSGSIGLNGTIPTDAPTVGATISFPANGATFTDTPIEVTGVCPSGLLVKLFKNEVFAGSAECSASGSFTITTDLFSGQNILIARVFDALDQPGPDSAPVRVSLNDQGGVSGAIDRVVITTNFAKRGAAPGQELTWPFTITGGQGPYAISINWGDGTDDLFSQKIAGEYTFSHVYERPGTYRIIVKVTDNNGAVGYIQVVGVATGATQDVANGQSTTLVDDQGNPIINASSIPETGARLVLWPLYLMMFLIFSTFWLGRRYEKHRLRKLAESGRLTNL